MLLPHSQSLCLVFFFLFTPLPCVLVVMFPLCTLQAAFLFHTVGWVLALRGGISVNCNYRWYTWLEGRDREKTQSRIKGKQSFAAKVGVTDYVKNTESVQWSVCVFAGVFVCVCSLPHTPCLPMKWKIYNKMCSLHFLAVVQVLRGRKEKGHNCF